MSGRFILGGGLSGLIYAFYHPDYTIISPNLGGKLVQDYLQATILLHDKSETRTLLEDLGVRADKEAHFKRYFYKGNLLDLEAVPEYVHQLLVKKKLTPWDQIEQQEQKTSIVLGNSAFQSGTRSASRD